MSIIPENATLCCNCKHKYLYAGYERCAATRTYKADHNGAISVYQGRLCREVNRELECLKHQPGMPQEDIVKNHPSFVIRASYFVAKHPGLTLALIAATLVLSTMLLIVLDTKHTGFGPLSAVIWFVLWAWTFIFGATFLEGYYINKIEKSRKDKY